MNTQIEIQSLTEFNFQEFLDRNLKEIFVLETEDYDYHYYFPSHYKITGSGEGSGKFMRQCA